MDLLDLLGIVGFLVVVFIFLGSAFQSIPFLAIGGILALVGCVIGIAING